MEILKSRSNKEIRIDPQFFNFFEIDKWNYESKIPKLLKWYNRIFELPDYIKRVPLSKDQQLKYELYKKSIRFEPGFIYEIQKKLNKEYVESLKTEEKRLYQEIMQENCSLINDKPILMGYKTKSKNHNTVIPVAYRRRAVFLRKAVMTFFRAE